MDLNELKPKSDTIKVTLLHPVSFEPILKEDGKEMTITAYLPFSKVYKQAVHEQANKHIQKLASKNKQVKYTAEDLDAANLELLSKITKEWDIVLEGKTPKCTPDNVSSLYKDFPWIKEQVEDAVNDISSFMKA